MTVECHLCKQEVENSLFLVHVPKCYADTCKKLGTPPLCTCEQCNGVRSHPTTQHPSATNTNTTTTYFNTYIKPSPSDARLAILLRSIREITDRARMFKMLNPGIKFQLSSNDEMLMDEYNKHYRIGKYAYFDEGGYDEHA